MANLIESYSKRMAIAESVYRKTHNGQPIDNSRKLILAACLNNVSKFVNEAFEGSVGTQRSQLGSLKQFCLNLTNVTLPSLIAPEIVLTQPMSSATGVVAYLEYIAGSNKGGITNGDGEPKNATLFNGVWGLGDTTPDRTRYTSASVVEQIAVDKDAEDAHAVSFAPMWIPIEGSYKIAIGATEYAIVAAGAEVADTSCSVALAGTAGRTLTVTFAAADTKFKESATIRLAYQYNNEVIPQNDLPIYSVRQNAITLVARARRIAIYYSQLAAFQAKQDYGFDLGENLATQAAAELAYEIDTECIQLLVDSTPGGAGNVLTFNAGLPAGVSMRDHYAAFAATIEQAKDIIYTRTKKFVPNYMLAASNLLPILTFMPGWTPAPSAQVNGPYFAGTISGLKVFISPIIPAGRFVLGVNGSDMMTSAAIFAPYMPVVPTQLLQYADGGTSQGFSTMYDLKLLSHYTGVNMDGVTGDVSPLLVGGTVDFETTLQTLPVLVTNKDNQAIPTKAIG